MPTWTPEQLRDYERKQEVRAARPKRVSRKGGDISGTAESLPQLPVRDDVLEESPIQEAHPRDSKKCNKRSGKPKYIIQFICFRVRLLDNDNLCTKFMCDGLRHAGIIEDDNPAICEMRWRQVRVTGSKREGTLIRVWEIDDDSEVREPLKARPHDYMPGYEMKQREERKKRKAREASLPG